MPTSWGFAECASLRAGIPGRQKKFRQGPAATIGSSLEGLLGHLECLRQEIKEQAIQGDRERQPKQGAEQVITEPDA